MIILPVVSKPFLELYPRKGLLATRQTFLFFCSGKKESSAKITEPSYSSGVPETIRTSGPFLRREVLYPAELRGQNRLSFIYQPLLFGKEFSRRRKDNHLESQGNQLIG